MFSDEDRVFIDRHRIAHLATADTAAAPHVIPICYALTGETFYVVIDDKPKRTRTGLKRLRNIEANPQVALVIDDYDDDWTRLAYLLVRGRAAVVETEAEYTRGLAALRARYPQYRAMSLALATHPMLRIVAERHHFWHAAAAR